MTDDSASAQIVDLFAVRDSTDASWMLDVLSEPINRFRISDRVVTYCNRAWADHYGVRASDVVGSRLDEFLSADELEGLRAQLREIGPERPVLVDSVARVDSAPTERWLQWVDHYVVTEQGPEILSVGRDVTERHLAQEALVESERRFRTLADASSDIVWRFSRSAGRFDYVSPSITSVLGLDPDHVLGDVTPLLELCEEETRETIHGLPAGGDAPTRLDLRVRHVDGRSVVLESSVSWGADAIQGVARDVTEIRNLQSTLEQSASTDALTGLANRRSFEAALDAELARTASNDAALAVVYIDLDRVKAINDRYGHEAGDVLLRETARRLVACADGADVVARLGGDEFVVVHEIRGDSVERLRTRLDDAFRLPVAISPTVSVVCSASVGVSDTDTCGHHAGALLAAADAEMYRVKQRRHPGHGSR